MALLPDILLPANARYFDFISTEISYNSEVDIVWSLQFRVPGDAVQSSDYEYGFSTYLTTQSAFSAQPGHYIGDKEEYTTGDTSLGDRFLVKVALDSTGLFGLSGTDITNRDGVGYNDIKRHSLSVRDYNQSLVFYESLSNLTTAFSLTSDDFVTLRFRYVDNGNQFFVDYLDENSLYQNLTGIELGYNLDMSDTDSIFIGYSFSTPISTTQQTLSVAEFHLKNIHIEGVTEADTSVETVTPNEFKSLQLSAFTTISNITAIK